MIEIINIYIEGHNYSHDLFELTRTFFKEKDIRFIEHKQLTNKYEYLLVSKLLQNEDKGTSITTLYHNREIVEEVKEDISDIKIPLYDKKNLQKLSVKKGVYDVLSKESRKILPWGILTGIRPVKVVHKLIDRDISQERILQILKNEYKFIDSKAKLILSVALSQRKHIYPIDKEKFSIYINIPFCPSKCSYCSFPSFKIEKNEDIVERYIDTLILEIKSVKSIFKNKRLNTIYMGGGTPTSLEVSQLERVIKEIKELFSEDIKEFTVEAGRPDTIDREKLEMLKSYGVNRLSINPQTFNNKTLKCIGRNHDIESIKQSHNLAKSLDFDIINMDIILGLPGEGLIELENTLKEIKVLNPDNLTVHTLSLKKGSRLYDGEIIDMNKKTTVEKMFERTLAFASEEGYCPYYMYRQKQILGNLENIGYSKSSKECVYNISMMEEKETVIGFGLGAVTKIYYPSEDKIKRIPNFKSLKDYIDRIYEVIQKKMDINFNQY